MLSIVLVSHSKTLVEGLGELLAQMNHDDVKITFAGGIDNDESPIGTDAMKVLAAIQEGLHNYNPKFKDKFKGVIVFMDIGSALMATETALDFLTDEEKEKVFISEGPIVEGSIVALGSALSNLSMKEICVDVANALKIKEGQLLPYLKHKKA